MFGKIIILSLALFAGSSYAQTCLNITGPCIGGQCLTKSDSCINEVCCTTNAAANCDNVLPNDFCEQMAAKCTDASTKDAMSKQCPKTCQTCDAAAAGTNTTAAPGGVTTAPGGTCVDKVGPSGTSDCQKDAYLCNNAVYYDLMTQQCPKTCGRCPGSSSTGSSGGSPASSACADKVGPNGTSDCQKDAYLCNNAQYYDLMTQQCPKTCGRC